MLSNKKGVKGVQKVRLANRLGISLPMGGGERLPLHHLLCLVFFLSSPTLVIKQFYIYPQAFLLLLFPCPSHQGCEEKVSSCVVLSCLLGLTHNTIRKEYTQ